ncbi:MAG: 50S ribosome-binding GTPase, partial [bacterium]
VGYTNAGKSTLFNSLTRADVPTGDRLFETLDATTRTLKLPMGEIVLLSDTVGFIRKIPHHLVASFRATLECVVEADLILHVADLGHPQYEHQIGTVREVMEEIGAGGKPELLVLNKVDVVENEALLKTARREHEEAVPVSAVHGWGIDALRERVLEFVMGRKAEVFISLPGSDGKLLSYVERFGTVTSREVRDGKVGLRVRIERRYLKPLQEYIEPIA